MVIFETKGFIMTKIYKKSYTLLAIVVLFLSLTGCSAGISVDTMFKGASQFISSM